MQVFEFRQDPLSRQYGENKYLKGKNNIMNLAIKNNQEEVNRTDKQKQRPEPVKPFIILYYQIQIQNKHSSNSLNRYLSWEGRWLERSRERRN